MSSSHPTYASIVSRSSAPAVPECTTETTGATSSVLRDLLQAYPTWEQLRDFLRSEEGGKLTVYETGTDTSRVDTHLAMIRYVKGVSIMSLPHVAAFRSVVWNTVKNLPVSVAAWKSAPGESLPALDGLRAEDIRVEDFVDGVMIGQFYDTTEGRWRFHTRSILDAESQYYSRRRSFKDLFLETAGLMNLDVENLDIPHDYTLTWVLSHPENRIVCPVQRPTLTLVACMRVESQDGTLILEPVPQSLQHLKPTVHGSFVNMATDTNQRLEVLLRALVSLNGSLQSQGIVVKIAGHPFQRWKLRSPAYNAVRLLRGNSANLDFLWMMHWSNGGLDTYLKFYPEERMAAEAVVQRWKDITMTVYNMYAAVFKARTTPRDDIPRKIKPLVLGLHTEYLNVLKPAGKTMNWRTVVQWMNGRDVAQKVFVLNWDLRQERSATYVPTEASV